VQFILTLVGIRQLCIQTHSHSNTKFVNMTHEITAMHAAVEYTR